MQQNSECIFCDDSDETVHHVSECSKVAQKQYKSKPDRVRKVIHWELCKILTFDNADKCSVLENEAHKIL